MSSTMTNPHTPVSAPPVPSPVPAAGDVFASLIPTHIERVSWSRQQIADHRTHALRALLTHASMRSPFHARRLRGIDLQRIEPDDLSQIPVMTKDEMMASFDEVVCDPRLDLATVERHLAGTGTEPRLLFDEYLVLASGGSSGVRGTFVYGIEAAAESLLGSLRGGMARLFASGAPPTSPISVAMVAASSGVHATRALAHLFGGGMMQVTSIPATIPLARICERLEAVQPLQLNGYPSVIAQLADERAAGRLSIAPMSVTTSSEPLTEELRARITAGFGLPVIDNFGTSEGLLGASEPGEREIVLPGDLAILELVDDDNRPVPAGTESSKVLLTMLNNPVQPLIRYELTDRMTLHAGNYADGHPRVTVSGRSDDLLEYDGALVHPHAIRSVFVNCASVREYQIRQTERGVTVDVVASSGHAVDTSDLRGRLVRALAAAGLGEAQVAVRVVADLARHPETGKVRRIIPLR